MTRVKTLKANGAPRGPHELETGHRHRVHRSKKNRTNNYFQRKKAKEIKEIIEKKAEKHYKKLERKII